MKSAAMVLFCTIFALPVILFPARADAAPAQEGGITFKDIEGKDWALSQIIIAGKAGSFDRKNLEADDMGGFFTINFQEGRASGVGAPNRYFAPYTFGNNRELSISTPAGTMMLALREPHGLNEKDYFGYLSTVTRWDRRDGKLELYSSGGGGTTLVFSLK